MSRLQALIFDVDGTLADTEAAHLAAFNRAFADLGLGWHWSVPEYTQLLHIAGGKERLAHYWRQQHPQVQALHAPAMQQRLARLRALQNAPVSGNGHAANSPPAPDLAALLQTAANAGLHLVSTTTQAMQESIARIHALKTAYYTAAIEDGAVPLRPGVLALLEAAASAGMPLAIATTTSPANIAALLRRALGADWRQRFAAVQDASTAPQKQPHPQAYQQALHALGLPASACLALEDSANGLQAARAAGLVSVITPTGFTADHDFAGALRVLPSLAGVSLLDLRQWIQGKYRCNA